MAFEVIDNYFDKDYFAAMQDIIMKSGKIQWEYVETTAHAD